MLVFMRALPGRELRATPEAPPVSVTRAGAYADQRRRILRAVATLVAQRGYPEVGIELISKQAHVSLRTFYKHYRSKEACFIDLFDSAVATATKEIRRQLEAEPLTWTEQVTLALRLFAEQIAAEPEIARSIIVEAPSAGPALSERYDKVSKAFVTLFAGGRELSLRGNELPESIEDTLAGAVFWTAYERLVAGRADRLVDHLPALTELVLRTYIGPEEAARIVREQMPSSQPAIA
jgi:AcrR family transcriptional regulator